MREFEKDPEIMYMFCTDLAIDFDNIYFEFEMPWEKAEVGYDNP
jgi:hypothetical protein